MIKNNNTFYFENACKLMNPNSLKNHIRIYSIVGNNLDFINTANNYSSIDSFVKNECFNKNGKIFIYIQKYINNFSKLEKNIITSIGKGNTKPTSISNNINVRKGLVFSTLNNLTMKNIIKCKTPVIINHMNNKTLYIYSLNINFLKFYFNFIYPYIDELLLNVSINAEQHFYTIFNYQFQGKNFENICKEIFTKFNNNQLNSRFNTLGSYWNKNNTIEFDIVAKDNNHIFLGECKFFKQKPINMRIYHHLKEKSKFIQEDKVIFGLFSVSGFSSELIELSKNCNHLLLFNNNEKL